MGATLFLGDWGKDGEYVAENDFSCKTIAAIVMDKPTDKEKIRARNDLTSDKAAHVSFWDGYCHRFPKCYYNKYTIFEGHAANYVGREFNVFCAKCGARHVVKVLERTGNSYRFEIKLDGETRNAKE